VFLESKKDLETTKQIFSAGQRICKNYRISWVNELTTESDSLVLEQALREIQEKIKSIKDH